MRKLSSQFTAERDLNAEELARERAELFKAFEAYNAFVEEHGDEYNRLVMDIKDSVNSLNIAIAAANGDYRKAANSAKRFMKKQPDKWLKGPEGIAYSGWATSLESVSYGEKIPDPGLETVMKLDLLPVPDPRIEVKIPGDEPSMDVS